ncbi:S41 family peptidase [Algibacter miyuki]|uniref:S41 family peptidase n=1 Tax=Algibacter miyuki TaxID=1306933 RepID=A0ABV5H402_9FLAO|nr:S41 family peptidase [Algibacter miyuki]MDN3665705.1 S41 family peptidase [Algibacter miyuki]
MKSIKSLVLILLIALTATSCFKDEDDIISTTSNKNDFVWQAMNSWYNWKNEVPALDDAQDDNSLSFQAYLEQYDTPENLFNSLIYKTGEVDRFSWFIEDYIEQEQAFQGITKSFGLRFEGVQINTAGDVVIYVRHVADNSPASDANINRGDIINAINGTTLTTATYNTAVNNLYEDQVTLSFVSENSGTLTPIGDKTITATVLSENPVFLTKAFNDIDGKKVGYLLYNGFRSSYNDELNAAFAYFKNENISELILDLRLNGGGSVETSAYLASMIYANATEDDGFAELRFNDKHDNENGYYNFTNTLSVYNSDGDKTGEQPINRLSTLTQLYVITSNNTASASEMIINGLRSYIPVKLIGATTYGKNVGSITLYDSPSSDYTKQSSANANHLNALQPIVFQIFNKDGESDYTTGFVPDIAEINEYDYWNNTLPFGDENEALLQAALNNIKGIVDRGTNTKNSVNNRLLEAPKSNNKFEFDMYINNDFFSN